MKTRSQESGVRIQNLVNSDQPFDELRVNDRSSVKTNWTNKTNKINKTMVRSCVNSHSTGDPTPIDNHLSPCDHSGLIGGKIKDTIGNVDRFSQGADWVGILQRLSYGLVL